MNHARLRRSAAWLGAAAITVGGLVAINAASNAATVPASGDRIAQWTAQTNSGSYSQVRLPDVAAPAGERFTEVHPAISGDRLVALTDKNNVVISGDAFPDVPDAVLDAPVRDLSGDGNAFAAVTQSGDVITWDQVGNVQQPTDLCDAEQVGLDSNAIAVICEDGSVEVTSSWDENPLLTVPDGLGDVQQIVVNTGIGLALNGDGRVIRWGQRGGVDFSEEIPETQGQDIAVIGAQHAITTAGSLISYDLGGRNPHDMPADEGGVDPAIMAEGVTSIASTNGSAFLTTQAGSYASWGSGSGHADITLRPLPADLADARLVAVNVAHRHVAMIIADTDPPAGPQIADESSVTGAAIDGTTVPGSTLTGVPATFDPEADEVTTDWLVDGTIVDEAVGQTTLEVTTAMVGQQITFRTTATSADLTEPLQSDSEPITVLAPEGRRVVTDSSITGTPVPGRWMEGVPAEYDSAPTSLSTRWYVDGEEVVAARNNVDLQSTTDMVGKFVTFESRATWSADQGALPPVISVSAPLEVRVSLTVVSEAVIEGEATAGSVVTLVSPPVFSDDRDDVVVVGQWQRDYWEPVGTGSTYTLTTADIGHMITYNSTAQRLPGEPLAYSFSNAITVVAAPLTITGTPVITGDPYIGEEISVAPAPVNDPEADVTLTWKVGGVPTDVTGTTFTPAVEHAGQTITVEQVASRGGATEAGPDYASAESAATAAVSERPADLAVEADATLSGTPLEGETLTGTPATFTPTEDVEVANFWVIGGTEVAAEGTSLVLTAEHVGQNIQFKSVATRGADTQSSTSATVGPVLAVLEATTPPTISGTPEVGQTLTATGATFSTTEGVAVTHQWLADGEPIDGATGPTLELTEAHLGAEISFESTATRGDDVVSSESVPTTEVTRVAIGVTSAPAISGEARDGETLTGTPAVFSITDGVTVINRWLADGAPIEGATGTTLELTADHVGLTITFESSATRGDETPVVSVSEPVGPVLPEAVDPEEPGEVVIELDGPTAPGATITVNVGTDFAGQQVQVYLSNLDRLLPLATVAEDGTIQVLVPGDIPLGEHRLAVYSGGALIGWDDFTVTLVRPEDPAFQDLITVDPDEVRPGQEVTVTVGADRAGQQVRVVVFSTARDLGFATVAADGTVKVTIPADLAAGVHRLAVYDAAGALIGYQDITVLGDSAGGGRNGSLPNTGAGDVGPMIPLGLTFLLAGLGLLAFRTRGLHQRN